MKYSLILLLLFAFLATNSLNLKANARRCRHLWFEQEVQDIRMVIGEGNITNRSSSFYNGTCTLVIRTQNKLASQIYLVFNDVQPQENRQPRTDQFAPLRQRPTGGSVNRRSGQNMLNNIQPQGNRRPHTRHPAPLRQRPTGGSVNHRSGQNMLNDIQPQENRRSHIRHAAALRQRQMAHRQMKDNTRDLFNIQPHRAGNGDRNARQQNLRRDLRLSSLAQRNQSQQARNVEPLPSVVRNMANNARNRNRQLAERENRHEANNQGHQGLARQAGQANLDIYQAPISTGQRNPNNEPNSRIGARQNNRHRSRNGTEERNPNNEPNSRIGARQNNRHRSQNGTEERD